MLNLPLQNIYNKGKTIYLFCRDNEGNLIIDTDETYYPFYYEPDTHGQFMSYDGKRLKKIYVSDPKNIRQVATKESYESDVHFTNRYILDRVDEIKKCPIKYAMIDIEIYQPEDVFSKPMDAKYPISSITLYNSFTEEYKNWFLLDYGDVKGFRVSEPEKLMFTDFMNYLKKEKFDIWFSWNVDYDFPYCYNRYNKLFKPQKYNNFSSYISPINRVRGSKKEWENIFNPAGCSIVDSLYFFKTVYKGEKSYALDSIAEKYLGRGKKYKNVNFSVLDETVRQRNIDDVHIMVELEEKVHLIEYYNELRRLAKISWEDLSYPLRIVEPFFFREAKKQNKVLPNVKKIVDENKIEAAFRDTYRTGKVKGVSLFDLSGAYLNTIVDLCLDTTNINTNSEDSILVNLTDRVSEKVIETYNVSQNSNTILPQVAKTLLEKKQGYKDLKANTSINDPEYDNICKQYDAIKGIVLTSYGIFLNRFFRLFDPKIGGLITSTVRDLLHYVRDELKKLNYELLMVDTDGIFVLDNGENIVDKLNQMIQDWSMERFNKSSDIIFDFAGTFESLYIHSSCRYRGRLKLPNNEIKIETKGLETVRSDSSKYISWFFQTHVDKILNEENQKKIENWILLEVKKIENNKVPLEDIAFPTHLNRKIEDYTTTITNKLGRTYTKKLPIHVRAYQNTMHLIPGFKKRLGEQYFYIYVKPFDNQVSIEKKYYFGRYRVDEETYNLAQNLSSIEFRGEKYNSKDFLDKITIKEKEKLSNKIIIAFDEKHKDEILSKVEVDYDKMIERNIWNKVDTIFNAMGWENTLHNAPKNAPSSPNFNDNNKAKGKYRGRPKKTVKSKNKENICDLEQCKQNKDDICKTDKLELCSKNNEQSIYENKELLKEDKLDSYYEE